MSALPVLEYMSRQLVIRLPYHPTRVRRFATELKKAIPKDGRHYNELRYRWEIRKRYAEAAKKVLRETCGDFRVVGDPKVEGADYVEHVDGERSTQALLF